LIAAENDLTAINCAGIPDSQILPYSTVPDGFCPFVFASGLSAPRGVEVVRNGDVLVLESGKAQITVLFDSNGDGISGDTERAVLASAPNLNHAVLSFEGFLYASNATTVFRWKYEPGQRTFLGNPTIIIKNVPCCHHVTRSLAIDSKGLLYVQSGSGSNVDKDSTHSRINRFDLKHIPDGGIDWKKGEIFADGLRNEIGIRFDSTGRLWGVENGCDNLFRADLGGDIHDNNPSEEMNLFAEPGKFYGYPYCWSEFDLPINHSFPRGSQWVHENFMNDGVHSDDWCRNRKNVVPPAWNFQAHMAPMDIIFWESSSFPSEWQGAFVSFHGSWDRPVPIGYRVDYVKFEGGMPVASQPFLAYQGPGAKGPNWKHRPTGMAKRNCLFGECLLVASDATGIIMAVGYKSS